MGGIIYIHLITTFIFILSAIQVLKPGLQELCAPPHVHHVAAMTVIDLELKGNQSLKETDIVSVILECAAAYLPMSRH